MKIEKGDLFFIKDESFHILYVYDSPAKHCIVSNRFQFLFGIPTILIEEFLRLQEKVEKMEKGVKVENMEKGVKDENS